MSIDSNPCALEVARVNYRGWDDSYVITNGIVRAVIVPAIGRVMQFGWRDGGTTVFWENEALAGPQPQSGNEWMNFGGDKAWPARQEDWSEIMGRTWPPPAGFESMPMQAGVDGYSVLLASEVDPHYGVRALRHISMLADVPTMVIKTIFCKVLGHSVSVGVWVVTQLRDPERVFALLSSNDSSYTQASGPQPFGLSQRGRLLSLKRDPQNKVKIEMDSESLAWVGAEDVLVLDGRDDSHTCSAAVYTNSDPLPYVELEIMGPVKNLSIGDHLELTTTYTLAPRTGTDVMAEASKAFGLEIGAAGTWM